MIALNSYENRVYLVYCDDAPSVVVKFYRPGRWTDAQIEEEHAFVARAGRSAKCRRSRRSRSTDATLHEDGDLRFAVYPRRGGRTPELDDRDTLTWLGRYIGRIHAVGATRRSCTGPRSTSRAFGDEPRPHGRLPKSRNRPRRRRAEDPPHFTNVWPGPWTQDWRALRADGRSRGRRMVFVDDVRRMAGGDWLVDRYELIGESARRIESVSVPDGDSTLLPLPQRVYLESKKDSAAMRRSLHPLVCYQPETGKVFFLNGRRGKQQAEYLCYDGGDVLRLDPGPDHRLLLSQVLGQPVDLETAAMWAAASSAEDVPDTFPPTGTPERTVGEFELLSRLGMGGMGVVYRAWQPSLGRQVALKCMIRSGDPKGEVRFAREIRALGKVEHPNLVKVYTSGSDGEQWFFAMELIEGAELSSVCEQLAGRDASTVDQSTWREAISSACSKARSNETPLSDSRLDLGVPGAGQTPPEVSKSLGAADLASPGGPGYIRRVVEIVERVADAVQALHEAGVIHRDIKPGNVMITADDQTPVLMDLGLAQVADETQGRSTHTRQFVGTLRYASPEQVLSAARVDRRSDVYSLGATLWELLTLRPLFGATDETTIPDLMLEIQQKAPASPRKYNAQVPRDLEAIVQKCLEKDRARRYSTAADLAADLNRFLKGEPVAAQPPSLGYIAGKYMRRHKLPLAATAAVVLMLTVGAVMAFYRINEERKDAVEARNREAGAKLDAQNRATEASTLASQNRKLAEQEAASRKEAERQLRFSRLAAYNASLDRASKLISNDDAAAVRILEDTEQCPPALRDFTWGHQLGLAHRERWVAACRPFAGSSAGFLAGWICLRNGRG